MNCYRMVNLLSINYDFLGKFKGKAPLGRPRRRWEYNIKMDIQEVECGVWIGSSWLWGVSDGGKF